MPLFLFWLFIRDPVQQSQLFEGNILQINNCWSFILLVLYGKILGFSLSMHFIRNISIPTHASKGHRVTETHQPKYFSNLKTVQLRDVHCSIRFCSVLFIMIAKRIMIRVAFLSARTCVAVLLSFASSCVCGVVCENPRRSANTGTYTCGTKITF